MAKRKKKSTSKTSRPHTSPRAASTKKTPPKRAPTKEALKQPDPKLKEEFSFLEDFFSWRWSHKPTRVDFGVFALGVFGNYPDYVELGEEAVTDSGDDKYIDLCHIDRAARRVHIGQAYVAEKWGKSIAPVAKADDLLNAVSYLMASDVSHLPPVIKSKAEELQQEIQSGSIEKVYLQFIHTCRNSIAVERALQNVEESARTLIGNDDVKVEALEIGLSRIQHHYDSLTKDIVVEDTIDFECSATSEEKGAGWRALSTTISGADLHDLWQKYEDDLFSANIRGFLDMVRRSGSVNSGILRTVVESPSAFWAFNNGVTMLSRKLTKTKRGVEAKGISVINGAQTTGVLGRAPRDKSLRVRVPCRFIQCTDQSLVQRIIESNNTQNSIRAFDFRSNDPTQARLRNEFNVKGIEYVHRRQGASRLPAGAIQAEVIARFLAAFHGEFQIAYRQQKRVFEDELIYGKVFTPSVSAEHLYLVQCLADAIHQYKESLRDRIASGSANSQTVKCHDLMVHASAKIFLVTTVGQLAEQIWGASISDLSRWGVKSTHIKIDRSKVVARWKMTVETLVPLVVNAAQPNPAAVVRLAEGIDTVVENVSSVIQSLLNQFTHEFQAIRDITDFR